MSPSLNLAQLRASLDRLVAPATLTLPNADIERLFLDRDGALGRLERFAKEHRCLTAYWHDGVVFGKLPAA